MRGRESKPARKIVLLGKTGDGKSSSGNTILGKQSFITESSPQSITSKSIKGVAKVDERKVTVIDTPGIFDTRLDEDAIKSEIIKSIIECAPAVDALVIVLKIERYTRQETEILDKIVECCGEETFKHSVVLFTHGEQLENQTIEGFVHKSPKLEELVNKCGGRCLVIDNKYWNDCDSGDKSNGVQVKNLLDTIDEMVNKNGYYTNELMLEIEDDIQDEMKGLLTTHFSDEEKREIAKKKVLKKYLIRFVAVTTGTLIGAFLGIVVAIGSVVALLKAAKLKDAIKAIGIALTAVGTTADKAAAAAAAGATAAGGAATVSATAAVVEAGLAATAAGTTAAATAGAAGATATAAATAGAAGASATAAATAGAAGASATAAATAGAAGATAAAGGVVAVEVGAAGAGIGAAAGSGIAVGVVLGAAALAGAIGGGFTGYRAADEADSVLDAIKLSAKVNIENAKEVVKKAEQLPSNIYKKLQ